MRALPSFAAALLATSVWAATPPAFRLPGDVVPESYELHLKLDPAQEDFSGRIAIRAKAVRPTEVIWLSAMDLTIDSAKLGDRTVKVVPGGKNFIGLEAGQPLSGPLELALEFHGRVSSKASEGLFRHKVGDEWYLFSQFESTSARRAFPCFDEPIYKVPWQFTLTVKDGQQGFANTSQVSEKSEGGWRTLTFAKSKPLPSYLVAFAAGPFDVVDAGRAGKNKTPLRFIVPKGKAEEATYAKETTGRVLELLEETIGIPYPYDKLDSVAVPLFFGAMENPGLITYDDGILLGKPGQDSPQRQRTWVEIAAHEMAHQWFGNLVTMGWWNDLWLNESFATWMEYKIPQKYKPEWKYNLTQVNSQSEAVGADRLASSQPIRRAVESQDDIANAFDGITYTKGSATLQMFESYLGEAKFREGVKNYLTRFSHGNARGENFLEAIASMGGPAASQAFASFLDQAGAPLVKVAIDCGQKPTLKIEQERSLPMGSKADANRTWRVPMCVSYDVKGKIQRECKIVEGRTASWTLTKAKSCPMWINANVDHAGYYQALYSGDWMNKLLADKGKHLNEAERMGTLNDVASLVNSGKIPVADALKLVPEFKDDPSRYTVGALIRIMEGAEALRLPEESRAAFGRFVNANFLARAKALGWKPKADDTQEARLLRAALLPFVTNAGEDPGLVAEARQLAEAWLADRASVPAEIAGQALRSAAMQGDAALFDRILEAASKETNRRPRGAMISALGAFHDPALARRALELTLSGKFDMREINPLLFGPGNYYKNQRLPIEFVKANYDNLAVKMPRAVDSDAASFLAYTASIGCKAADREEAQAFFGPRAEKWVGGKLALQEALESIALCEARNAQLAGPVAGFLRGY